MGRKAIFLSCSIVLLLSFSAPTFGSAYQSVSSNPDEPDRIENNVLPGEPLSAFGTDVSNAPSFGVLSKSPIVGNAPSVAGNGANAATTLGAAQAQAPLSNRVVDYSIDVAFDPTGRTLVGSETIRWRNPGALPVGQLYFHLYPNAFESPNTTFMKEQRTQNGEHPSVQGDMRIAKMTLSDDDRLDLLAAAQYVQPDDGNPDDRTLLRVDLPAAAAPGQEVRLQVRFRVDLPDIYRRMGAVDNFVMAGQWFPKLAVYEPKGMRGRADEGWNLHQYHANSEFYADFGTYDVTIHVPLRYKVAASGSLRQSTAVGNGRIYRFTGEDIHDFSWAASPDFQYTSLRIRPYPGSPDVKIKLYTDARSSLYRDRYLMAVQKALAHYAEWFGPYPYPTLSIVVPPAAAAKAGSMEYPTLITAKSVAPNETPDFSLERVIMHELAHQYFYGMVANNEFEEAWLDEAFAVYTEDRAMQLDYGQARDRLPVGQVKNVVQNSWLFPSRFDYEDTVYFRGKMMLDSLAFRIGQTKLDDVLRTYFVRYRFRHPSTADFVSVLEERSGQSWHPFVQELLYGNAAPAHVAESQDPPATDVALLGAPTASSVIAETELPSLAAIVPDPATEPADIPTRASGEKSGLPPDPPTDIGAMTPSDPPTDVGATTPSDPPADARVDSPSDESGDLTHGARASISSSDLSPVDTDQAIEANAYSPENQGV